MLRMRATLCHLHPWSPTIVLCFEKKWEMSFFNLGKKKSAFSLFSSLLFLFYICWSTFFSFSLSLLYLSLNDLEYLVECPRHLFSDPGLTLVEKGSWINITMTNHCISILTFIEYLSLQYLTYIFLNRFNSHFMIYQLNYQIWPLGFIWIVMSFLSHFLPRAWSLYGFSWLLVLAMYRSNQLNKRHWARGCML